MSFYLSYFFRKITYKLAGGSENGQCLWQFLQVFNNIWTHLGSFIYTTLGGTYKNRLVFILFNTDVPGIYYWDHDPSYTQKPIHSRILTQHNMVLITVVAVPPILHMVVSKRPYFGVQRDLDVLHWEELQYGQYFVPKLCANSPSNNNTARYSRARSPRMSRCFPQGSALLLLPCRCWF